MLFLVTGEIQTSHYMQDGKESEQVLRLVDAEDEREAEQKFTDHYRNMSREYDRYVTVHSADASSVIT